MFHFVHIGIIFFCEVIWLKFIIFKGDVSIVTVSHSPSALEIEIIASIASVYYMAVKWLKANVNLLKDLYYYKKY